jgi:hypothetical protein
MKVYLVDKQRKNPLLQNTLSAKTDFESLLQELGLRKRLAPLALIAFREWNIGIGWQATLFFPETIKPAVDYSANRQLPNPDYGLHTICATFHQIGIHSYFCSPVVEQSDDTDSIKWQAVQLGLPVQQPYFRFPDNINGFQARSRRYNFLRYSLDVSSIPENTVPEEFSKEHLRVSFQNRFMSEMADVDGIFWGNQFTYPVEIKEKTPARDNKVGSYFGLDVGPFVKLAFYAAKRGNLHSVFVVREIDNPVDRDLVEWWIITFEQMAQFASWNPIGGGTNMRGGGSTTIKIPKSEFSPMNLETLKKL